MISGIVWYHQAKSRLSSVPQVPLQMITNVLSKNICNIYPVLKLNICENLYGTQKKYWKNNFFEKNTDPFVVHAFDIFSDYLYTRSRFSTLFEIFMHIFYFLGDE